MQVAKGLGGIAVTRLALVNARLITGDAVVEGSLVVEEGRIAAVGPGVAAPADAEVVDLGGCYLAPGFIELHTHGGGGYSLLTEDPAEVGAYARWVAARGVTSFLIGVAGGEHERTLRALRRSAAFFDRPSPGPPAGRAGAEALGYFLEGPFLNPRRKGAFPEAWLRAPDVVQFRQYVQATGGRLRLLTLAPELPGGDALIAAALEAGTVPSMGHTDATYEEALHSFEVGIRHVTHCFNGMRPLAHRDPGCLGAALTSPSVICELILDGSHVHPAAAALLVRAKGVDGTVLITDAIPPAGGEGGTIEWEGIKARVVGKAAVREDGSIIGSVGTADDLVRNAVAWLPVTLPEAVRMVAHNPARVLGLEGQKGSLRPGADADLVVLDDELQVVMTLVGGRVVYRRGEGL
jgi:N-acetylglucosamine-6-phosphate deacetylase